MGGLVLTMIMEEEIKNEVEDVEKGGNEEGGVEWRVSGCSVVVLMKKEKKEDNEDEGDEKDVEGEE